MAKNGAAVYLMGGGPTAVINRTLVAAVRAHKQSPFFDKLLGARFGIDTFTQDRKTFIDFGEVPDEKLKQVMRTPGAWIGSTRTKPIDKKNKENPYWIIEQFVETCKKHNIRFVFYNGGNDTALACLEIKRIAREKFNYEITAVHLSKTVDNDLVKTDRCPGWLSAARYVATKARLLYAEAASFKDSVIIMEVMGRNSGFLTASSAFARMEWGPFSSMDWRFPPNLVFLPETPFEGAAFLDTVRDTMREQGSLLIAVSEGVRVKENGGSIPFGVWLKNVRGEKVELDSFGQPLLTNAGVAEELARLLKDNKVAKRTRAEVLGYGQRCDVLLTSPQDEVDAFIVGTAGVKYATEGRSGSVVLKPTSPGAMPETELVPLEEVGGKTRYLDTGFIDAKNQPSNEFILKYRPLVGELHETAAPPGKELEVNL